MDNICTELYDFCQIFYISRPRPTKGAAVLLDSRAMVVPDANVAAGEHPSSVAALNGRAILLGWTAAMAAADAIGPVFLALAIHFSSIGPLYYGPPQFLVESLVFLFSWILTAASVKLYSKRLLLGNRLVLVLMGIVACAMSFGLVMLIELATNQIGNVSRVFFLSWATGVFIWASGLRYFWTRRLSGLLRRGDCLERVIVLAETKALAHSVGDAVSHESGGRVGIELATSIPGMPDAPSAERIEDIIKRVGIDRVIIAKYDASISQTSILLKKLARISVSVTLIPDIGNLGAAAIAVDRIGVLPTIELRSPPLTDAQSAMKRVEDIFVACVCLPMLAPLFAIIALAIRIDSRGPVFFGQKREGYHSQPFWLWKFRTMYHEARDPGCLTQTSRDDARVTRIGRILRRYSFDEIPQLINVLRGEMSIVGPRPHAPGMTAVGSRMYQVMEDYPSRYRLKPGITGWAQVNRCRGEIDTQEKLRRRVFLDCYYIDNWSLSLDIWIIIRTVALLLFDEDAY